MGRRKRGKLGLLAASCGPRTLPASVSHLGRVRRCENDPVGAGGARHRLDLDQVDGAGAVLGVEVDEREAGRLLPDPERAPGPDGAAVDEDVRAFALDVLAWS